VDINTVIFSYQPARRPALEIYLKSMEEIGWTTFDIECCAPVQPLS